MVIRNVLLSQLEMSEDRQTCRGDPWSVRVFRSSHTVVNNVAWAFMFTLAVVAGRWAEHTETTGANLSQGKDGNWSGSTNQPVQPPLDIGVSGCP